MFDTPYTRTRLRAKESHNPFFAPKRGANIGQAWGFLAHHLSQEDGVVTCNLQHLINALLYQQYKGSVALFERDGGCDLALVFNDSTMVVGRIDSLPPPLRYQQHREMPDQHAYTPYTVRFSPVVFSAKPRHLSSTQPINSWSKGLYAPAIGQDAPCATFAKALHDAVDDGIAMGRVLVPWLAQPGDLVAPWAIGRAIPDAFYDLVGAGLVGLQAHRGPVEVIHVSTFALDNTGTLDTQRVTIEIPDHQQHPSFPKKALEDWINRVLGAPSCPIPRHHLLHHSHNGKGLGNRASRLIPGRTPIVMRPNTPLTHHQQLQALALYHASATW